MSIQVVREISSPHVQAIIDYWHQIRGERPAPDAAEVDPVGIPTESLHHVILADLELNPFRVRYRLVGGHQTDLFGDYRGRYLDQLGLPDGVDQVLADDYRQAAATLVPVVGSYPWPKKYGRPATVNYALMPLLRDGVVVRFPAAEHIVADDLQERLERDDLVHLLPPKQR